MPNIWICGYSNEQAAILKKRIDEVLGEMGLAHEAITSTISLKAETCDPENYGRDIKPASYLRVYSTRLTEVLEIIANLQRAGIYEDAELEVLGGFVSKEQMRAGEIQFRGGSMTKVEGFRIEKNS